MQNAVYAPTFNDYGEPARLLELARGAAGWDGIFPVRVPQNILDGAPVTALDGSQWWLTPQDFVAVAADIGKYRTTSGRCDVLASGHVAHWPSAQARAHVAAYGDAGATWWCEWVDEAAGRFAQTLAAIDRGPPR